MPILDPERGYFRPGWGGGERPAELEIHLTEHLRDFTCQRVNVRRGQEGDRNLKGPASSTRGLDEGASPTSGETSPASAQASALVFPFSPRQGASSGPWKAPTPAQ